MTNDLHLAAIPHPLTWATEAAAFTTIGDDAIEMSAARQTDLFIDPRGAVTMTNSARLLFQPDARFMLSAHAHGNLVATYDAAVLMLYVDDRHWAKLCLERSPQGEPMIVSVVTNGVSDDCNSVVLDTPAAHLRVAGLGSAFALHYSQDGVVWHFVRYFALQAIAGLRVGFSVQAPTGEGCTVRFTGIRYTADELADLRTGV